MDAADGLETIRGAALQAVVDALRAGFSVDRCTLRLEGPDQAYDVAYEARLPHARTLIADTEISLKGQPVVVALTSGEPQVVQHDSAAASDDPAFHRMLASYGGMGAQIVTAVRVDGALLGIISLHHLGGPRTWSDEEIALASDAAALVGRILRDAAA